MKWIAISGSWRKTSSQVKKDVIKVVTEIIRKGDGIVSGGALNVDYIATQTALKLDPSAKQIKIFLPTTLKKYSEHYRKHAEMGDITKKAAEDLIDQLNNLKKANQESLIECSNECFNEETKMKMYFERNGRVIDAADSLIAFHVNNSKGVTDTVSKAEKRGIPVKVLKYNI